MAFSWLTRSDLSYLDGVVSAVGVTIQFLKDVVITTLNVSGDSIPMGTAVDVEITQFKYRKEGLISKPKLADEKILRRFQSMLKEQLDGG